MPREWLQYPYHFSAFFILAFLFRRSFSGSTNHMSEYKFAVFSLLGCALVSVCSEALQFYVPTRTPALRDLVLDQSGAVLGMVIVMRHFSDKVGRGWQ
ncbi:MAG: VanZ family protein [Candidatus Binatia bacterium]